MQHATLKCPSCKIGDMISGGIHGMEHNVCTKCGTVLESEQFTVDVYEGGCTEVKPDFDGRPYSYSFLISKTSSQNSRNHREGLVILRRLMDGLDLPVSVRDTAMEYFRYTKRLSKVASAGAVVYLAMKDFHMPVTMRCIANYLQVSHYSVGRIMRVLEKKLEHKRTHGRTFEVNELIPHLFSQATFGVKEEKKGMLDLVLKKTDQLLCLLKECMATTGYAPHLIALAAGYIVWKHLNITKWSELKVEVDKLPIRPASCLTARIFLSEIGVLLPNVGDLTSKISLIQNVLCKLSEQIPWLSISDPSNVIIHLNDFLKYKSQIIDMTAKELAEKDKNSNNEFLMSKQVEHDMQSRKALENSLDTSGSSVIETSSLLEGSGLPSTSISKQDCISEEKSPAEKSDKSLARSYFTRSEPNEGNGSGSDGYNKLLFISHPNIGKRKRKNESRRVNPLLLIP